MAFKTVYPRPPSDVFVDALGERVRFLEYHTNSLADFDWIYLLGIDVLAVKKHLTFRTCNRDQVIHAVKSTYYCAFSTPRWTDNGCDLLAFDIQIHILDGQKIPIKYIYIASFNTMPTV